MTMKTTMTTETDVPLVEIGQLWSETVYPEVRLYLVIDTRVSSDGFRLATLLEYGRPRQWTAISLVTVSHGWIYRHCRLLSGGAS